MRKPNTYYAKVTTLPGTITQRASNSATSPKPPVRKQSILSEADLRRQSLISAFMAQKTVSQTQVFAKPRTTISVHNNLAHNDPAAESTISIKPCENLPPPKPLDFSIRQSLSNVKIEEPDYDCVADITAGIAAKAARMKKDKAQMRRKTLTDSQQELKQILDVYKPVVKIDDAVKPELPLFLEDEPADTLSSSEHVTFF